MNFGRRNILFIASRWGLEFLKVSCHSSIYDESFLSLFVQYLFQVYLDFAAIHGPFLAPTKRIICEIRAACPTFIDANLIIVTDVGFFFLSVLNYSQRIVRNLFISLSRPASSRTRASSHVSSKIDLDCETGPGLKSRPGHSFSQAPGSGDGLSSYVESAACTSQAPGCKTDLDCDTGPGQREYPHPPSVL